MTNQEGFPGVPVVWTEFAAAANCEARRAAQRRKGGLGPVEGMLHSGTVQVNVFKEVTMGEGDG